jgi:hypothetical protein
VVRISSAKLAELGAETLPGFVEPVPLDERRARAGSKAARSGRDFERELAETVHALYAETGIARLEFQNPPTVPTVDKSRRPGGKSKPAPPLRRIVGSAPFDFVGSLGPATFAPARAVAIEAKSWSSGGASLPIVSKAESKAKGHKGKGAGLDLDDLRNLAELVERWGWLSLVVWRVEGRVAVLLPDMLVRVAEDASPGDRIPRTWFHWITEGSIDYLRPSLACLGLLDRSE